MMVAPFEFLFLLFLRPPTISHLLQQISKFRSNENGMFQVPVLELGMSSKWADDSWTGELSAAFYVNIYWHRSAVDLRMFISRMFVSRGELLYIKNGGQPLADSVKSIIVYAWTCTDNHALADSKWSFLCQDS